MEKVVYGTIILFLLIILKVCWVEMNEPLHDYQEFGTKKAYTIQHTGIKAKVVTTMYNAVEDQCDSDPLVTAGNYKINPKKASKHKWVALSRNLLKRWGGEFDYGDKVMIKRAGHKNGLYTVVDTMNERFENYMDILETSGTKWYKFKSTEIEKVIIIGA